MRRVDFEQGSDLWLEWRQGGIGGSDAASILNVAPAYWQNANRAALLAYKAQHIGRGHERKTDKNKTAAMMRGTLLEPASRQAYRERTGNHVEPACVMHDSIEWLRASCDGLNKDGSLVVEIKNCNHNDHEVALGGMVPTHYYPQCIHLLLVTGAPILHYWSCSAHKRFRPQDLQALVPVKPSKDYMEYLLKEETLFWNELQELIKQRKANRADK